MDFDSTTSLGKEDSTRRGTVLYISLADNCSISSQSSTSGSWGSAIIRSGNTFLFNQCIAVNASGADITWKCFPRTVWRTNLIALLLSIARIVFFILEIFRNFSTGTTDQIFL